jgi:predicted aspartyl protease
MRATSLWWALVLTASVVVGQPLAYGYSDVPPVYPPKTKTTTVGFELYRDYLIVVHGSAGPLKGLNFLLDTGATPSVLDTRLAAKLHLDSEPIDIAVLNGSVSGGTATAPTLDLGPIHRNNLPVLIEDLSFLQKALPVQIDGMIGLDMLGSSAFVLDYTRHELRFGPVPAMPVSIPLQMNQGLAILDATINHAPVHLLLDTGSPSLILFDASATPTAKPDSAASTPPKAIGDVERREVHLNSLRLGAADFGREQAFLIQTHKDPTHNFDGLISPAALGITQIAIDLSRGTLAFTR